MRVKMKAEIYYLTKEMRDNPATWHSADETINAITYNKKKCYAKHNKTRKSRGSRIRTLY